MSPKGEPLPFDVVTGKIWTQIARASKFYASSAVSFILIATGVVIVLLGAWLRYLSPDIFQGAEFLGLAAFGVVCLTLGCVERFVILRSSPEYLASVAEALKAADQRNRAEEKGPPDAPDHQVVGK